MYFQHTEQNIQCFKLGITRFLLSKKTFKNLSMNDIILQFLFITPLALMVLNQQRLKRFSVA